MNYLGISEEMWGNFREFMESQIFPGGYLIQEGAPMKASFGQY